MANKDTVKQWFETGDFPTQTQFYQKFDWLRWIDEKISFTDLDPALQALLNTLPKPVQVETLGADGFITIPADCEVWMVTFKSAIGGDTIRYYKDGFYQHGDDSTYIDENLLITGNRILRSRIGFDVPATGKIHFEGITHDTIIKIYKA